MKNKKSKVLKLYTKGLKQGMDESLIQALQERIKELEKINEEHRKINGELREENKRLKELCDKYEEEHNTAFKLWKMKIEDIPTYEEKKELQNRIDKAIKSIERGYVVFCEQDEQCLLNFRKNLLKILKGE